MEILFIWLIDCGCGVVKYCQCFDYSIMSKEDGLLLLFLFLQFQYCMYEMEEWVKGVVFYDGQYRYMEVNSYGLLIGMFIDFFFFNEGGVGYIDEWFQIVDCFI